MNWSSGILLMSVLFILLIVELILFDLVTLMFVDKFSFVAEYQISGHFIKDTFTPKDLGSFGITGNVCRGILWFFHPIYEDG